MTGRPDLLGLFQRGPVRGRRATSGSKSRAGASRTEVMSRWRELAMRGLKLLSWGVAAAALLLAAVLVAPVVRDGLDQPIRHVRILSELYYQDPEEVRAVIARHRLDRFFQVDLANLRRELNALHWVQEAHVRRVWPDRLELRLREQIPVARWGNGALLNEHGSEFPNGFPAAFDKLPLLDGPDGSTGRVLDMHQRIAPMLAAQGLRLAELRLSDRGAWDVKLDNGVLVRLGRREMLPRLNRFLAFYQRKLRDMIGTVAVVDTRYSRGIAVTWAESPAAGGEANG